jgi:capsid protein
VIHVYLPNRTSENRGVTWFSANVQPARDLDWYLGNELTAAALGALLTAVVKRKNGAGKGLGFAGDDGTQGSVDPWGNPFLKMGRGIVADIGTEDSIEMVESKRPSRDARPFLDLILLLQGMGVGLSYLRLTGDYTHSSYTSARGAHLDDQAFFCVLQAWLSHNLVVPVRKACTVEAAAYGLFRSVSARQFAKNRKQMLRVIAQPPGREQLDPEKETQAAAFRIRAGFSTHQIECGLRGQNWRRIARQRKREVKFFGTDGVMPDLTPLATMTAPHPDDRASGAGGAGNGNREEAN